MDLHSFAASATPTPKNAVDARANSGMSSLRIREGQVGDLFPLMEVVTQELSLGRRHLALANVSEAVKGHGGERVTSIVADRDGKVVAGTLATRLSNDAAQFIGIGCHESIDPDQQRELIRSLSERLHQRLQHQGIQFVQASCDADDPKPACATVGYEWIATLDYLNSAVVTLLDRGGQRPSRTSPSPWRAAGLDCLPIDPSKTAGSRQRMVELVQATYEQTFDCPRLNSFRSAADVVGGYLSVSSFQPDGWRVISDNGRDVACLVTVFHSAVKAMELTYMGIIPSHRGRGIGRRLVSEAGRIAREKAAQRVVLAVDRANEPACGVYRQCGFENGGSEAVWGRKSSPASSGRASEPTPANLGGPLRVAS